MSIINILLKLSPALEAGKELADSATWKNRAVSTGLIVAVIQFTLMILNQFGIILPADQQLIDTLANGISGFGVLIVSYLHVATSKKIGLNG